MGIFLIRLMPSARIRKVQPASIGRPTHPRADDPEVPRASLPSGLTNQRLTPLVPEFRFDRKLIQSPRGDHTGTATVTRESNSRVTGRMSPSAT